MTCTFAGDCTGSRVGVIEMTVADRLRELVALGIRRFVFGGGTRFERICYREVTSLMWLELDIERIYCIDTSETTDKWRMGADGEPSYEGYVFCDYLEAIKSSDACLKVDVSVTDGGIEERILIHYKSISKKIT